MLELQVYFSTCNERHLLTTTSTTNDSCQERRYILNNTIFLRIRIEGWSSSSCDIPTGASGAEHWHGVRGDADVLHAAGAASGGLRAPAAAGLSTAGRLPAASGLSAAAGLPYAAGLPAATAAPATAAYHC